MEEKGATDVDGLLARYSVAVRGAAGDGAGSARETGAVILCVIGGKLSEGINFSDDLARVVVVVGQPYPNKADPETAVRMGVFGGQGYLDLLCWRAVNQSIGARTSCVCCAWVSVS